MTNPSDAFASLADPTRRKIFERLARKSLSVAELAERLPVTRPAVSQHLKVLKDAGMVDVRVEGRRHVYFVNASAVAAMRTYLDRHWEMALAAFKAAAESESDA
ncbi:MAG TPA: metalloregulator ArsR/SmtB family transcription factor [Thermoanaerobaculia bacterium]|jgi:DNA-binding transcriptional ArsR family regulator|nr:metalloregulator ArsR/SmtB family transcription factor [Thermoanaerobaculia bacterium]